MRSQYHVTYSTEGYEGTSQAVFNTMAEVLELLNKHAQNPAFHFEVIYGVPVEFEPRQIIQGYRVKEERGRHFP